MCGLVAVVTKSQYGFSSEQNEIFSVLLYLDVLRGEDSTGVFVVDNNGNVALAKDALPSADFIRTEEYKNLKQLSFKQGWAMVGHNRKATRGDITDRNAHPFAVDDKVVLVHNGSLSGDHKHHADTEVDSEAVAHVLAREANPEVALRKINGAFALMWYEVDHKRLNFIRNMQRPMWIVETNQEYIFASEKCFLDLVVDRFNLKSPRGPLSLKEYNLMTLELSGTKQTKESIKELDCSYHKHNPVTTTTYTSSRGSTVQNFPFPALGYQGANANGYAGWPEDDDGTCDLKSGNFGRTLQEVLEDDWIKRRNDENNKRVINTLEQDQVKRLLDALTLDFTSVPFSTFTELNDVYKKGDKVKVIVSELTEATDEPRSKEFLMIGKTLNNQQMYAVFHMHEDQFETACRLANDGLFEVEVNRLAWHRTEGSEASHSGKPMADWQGVLCLHAVNATPISIPTMSEAIHNATQH